MNKFGVFLLFLAFIVVIAAGIYITNPFQKIADYNDRIRISDLQKISQALEKYRSDYGRYPSSSKRTYMITVDDETIPWGTSWEPYIGTLPKDPSSVRRYVYIARSEDNYQSYKLYASLEDPGSEPGACSVSGECQNVPAQNLCGTHAKCNFGVTSSNTSP